MSCSLRGLASQIRPVPKMHKLRNTIMGTGSGLSAVCGAPAVKNLAKKFIKPRACAAKTSGNISNVEVRSRRKQPAIPNFARLR